MATKLHEETFNTLQHTKHRVNENIAPSLFPTADELNDTEYWLFSDLYNLFGEQYGHAQQNPRHVFVHNKFFRIQQIARHKSRRRKTRPRLPRVL